MFTVRRRANATEDDTPSGVIDHRPGVNTHHLESLRHLCLLQLLLRVFREYQYTFTSLKEEHHFLKCILVLSESRNFLRHDQ